MVTKYLSYIAVVSLVVGSSYTSRATQNMAEQANRKSSHSAPEKTKSTVSFMSFRQWKNERIQESTSKLNTTRTQFEAQRMGTSKVKTLAAPGVQNKTEATSGIDTSLNKLEAQLRLDLMSLELAKDLTVTDYFVGYVSKIKDKKNHMSEIAAKMSTDEVAELMNAYAQSVFGSTGAESPKTATAQESK